jgi:hypothetical protein
MDLQEYQRLFVAVDRSDPRSLRAWFDQLGTRFVCLSITW